MKNMKSLACLVIVIIMAVAGIANAMSQYYVQGGKLILTLPTPPATPIDGDNQTIVIPTLLYQDNFDGNTLSSNWLVENTTTSVTLYTPFTPPPDHFTISARVSSTQLAAFALRLHSGETPIYNSTSGIQVEMNRGDEDKHFTAAWSATSITYNITESNWEWHNFTNDPISLDTWYIVEMTVQSNPYTVIFKAYSDNYASLLGSYTTNDITVPYSSIQYICLETWSGPSNYSVDWVKIVA
jgi:hypothetical protein